MLLVEVPFPYKIFIDTGVICRFSYSQSRNKCHKQELECKNYFDNLRTVHRDIFL